MKSFEWDTQNVLLPERERRVPLCVEAKGVEDISGSRKNESSWENKKEQEQS